MSDRISASGDTTIRKLNAYTDGSLVVSPDDLAALQQINTTSGSVVVSSPEQSQSTTVDGSTVLSAEELEDLAKRVR